MERIMEWIVIGCSCLMVLSFAWWVWPRPPRKQPAVRDPNYGLWWSIRHRLEAEESSARLINAYYRQLIDQQMRSSSTPFRGGTMEKTKEEQAVLDAVSEARNCHNLPLDDYLCGGSTNIRVSSTLFHCILVAEEARRESLKPKTTKVAVTIHKIGTYPPELLRRVEVELAEGELTGNAYYAAYRRA